MVQKTAISQAFGDMLPRLEEVSQLSVETRNDKDMYQSGLEALKPWIKNPDKIVQSDFMASFLYPKPGQTVYPNGTVVRMFVSLENSDTGPRIFLGQAVKGGKLPEGNTIDNAMREYMASGDPDRLIKLITNFYAMIPEGGVLEIGLKEEVTAGIETAVREFLNSEFGKEFRGTIGAEIEDRFVELRSILIDMEEDHAKFETHLVFFSAQLEFLRDDMLNAVVELGKRPTMQDTKYSSQVYGENGRALSTRNSGSGTQVVNQGDSARTRVAGRDYFEVNFGARKRVSGSERVQMTRKTGRTEIYRESSSSVFRRGYVDSGHGGGRQ